MALPGHVTAGTTLRYATLANPTLRHAHDEAMSKGKRHLPILIPNRPAVPERAEWLRSVSVR